MARRHRRYIEADEYRRRKRRSFAEACACGGCGLVLVAAVVLGMVLVMAARS